MIQTCSSFSVQEPWTQNMTSTLNQNLNETHKENQDAGTWRFGVFLENTSVTQLLECFALAKTHKPVGMSLSQQAKTPCSVSIYSGKPGENLDVNSFIATFHPAPLAYNLACYPQCHLPLVIIACGSIIKCSSGMVSTIAKRTSGDESGWRKHGSCADRHTASSSIPAKSNQLQLQEQLSESLAYFVPLLVESVQACFVHMLFSPMKKVTLRMCKMR